MREGRTKLNHYKKQTSLMIPALLAGLVLIGVAALTYVRVAPQGTPDELKPTEKIEQQGATPSISSGGMPVDDRSTAPLVVVAAESEAAADVVAELVQEVAEVKEAPAMQGPTNAQIAKAGTQLQARMASKRVVPPEPGHTKELFRRSMNLESLEVSGEGMLDLGTFKKEFMMKQPEFFACAKSARERGVALAGEVTLAFEVSPDGRIHKGDIVESTIEDMKFRHCVVFKLGRMTFTPPAGGVASVRYILKF